MPTFACCQCGKSFSRIASKVKDINNTYCSATCRDKARRRRVTKTCTTCGKSYECRQCDADISRFCSAVCKVESTKNQVRCTCEHCGNEFLRKPSRVKKVKHSYCSEDCHNAAQKTRVLVPCAGCGALLERRPSEMDYKRQFCSLACRSLVATSNKRVIVQCHRCGKSFERWPHHVRERNFCGGDCRRHWHSETFRGESSPAWKGGWKSYYGPNWNSQSRKARKRDNYCCRICGYQQKKHYRALDVHHLVPFREFGYVAGENENYLPANDLSNLITVCPTCHNRLENGHTSFQLALLDTA